MEILQFRETLRGYIREHFAIPTDDVAFTDDVHLFDYGYVDCWFGAVELLSFVEQSFGIEVSQADLLSYPFNTITEIATFVSLRKRGSFRISALRKNSTDPHFELLS